MKQGKYTEKELIDIFISSIQNELFEVVNINHIVHFIYNDEDYYAMLRCVSYAGNPHPLHRFRAQLPTRPYLEQYKSNGGIFLFIGYDVVHNVYVIWNPFNIRHRLNERASVSLFCELPNLIKAKDEGIAWSILPNGGLYVAYTPENFSSILDSLSFFKNENTSLKCKDEIKLEPQLSQFIIDLRRKDLSRLEMAELCIGTYGHTHPNWSFLDWRKCIERILYAVGE